MAKTKVHGEYLDPSVISGQTQVTAVGADSVLILDATDNALKKALLSDVIETVGSTPSFTSVTISGDLTTTGNINLGDDDKVVFGAGSDLEIYHTATNNHSIIEETGGGNLVVRTNGAHIEFDKGSSEFMARMLTDGAVELYHDGSKKLETTSSGINVDGGITSSSDLTLTSAGPSISLIDSDNNPDYQIKNGNGAFRIIDTTNSVDRINIDTSGNVGINTSSPSAPLHVDGAGMGDIYTGRIENSTTETDHYNVIRFFQGASGSATGFIGTGGSTVSNVAFRNTFVVGTQSNHHLVFATDDAERMRVRSDGKVLIGTTEKATVTGDGLGISSNAVGSNALNGALSLRGSGGDFYADNYTTTQAGTNGAGFGRLAAFSPTTDYLAMQYRTGGSSNNVLIQYYDGDVTITGTLTENSDIKLKKDIKDLPSQLENIKQLRPVTYTKKATGKSEIGFIAQELETVYTKEFTETKEQPTCEHDSDGNVLKEEIKVLSYGRLTAVLTKAIQEQQEQIESLKKEVEELKGG